MVQALRQLTKKQKQLLDKFYEENKDDLPLCFQLEHYDKFNYDLMEELREINDTEILNQEINRYISDKVSHDLNSKYEN